MFFNILQHPLATLVILVSTRYAEESAMISDNSPTELGDVVVEVY